MLFSKQAFKSSQKCIVVVSLTYLILETIKEKRKMFIFRKDDYEELCLQEWSKAVSINLLMTVLVIITYELV